MEYINTSPFEQLSKAYDGDAGYDVYSNQSGIVPPLSAKLFSTGLYVRIPQHHVGILKSRSGNAVNKGFEVGAGIIDTGYLGEIFVLIRNMKNEILTINKGDKIAQLIITEVYDAEAVEVDEFGVYTERSEKGFGSSDEKIGGSI